MRQYLQPCAHLDGRLADLWCKNVEMGENYLLRIGCLEMCEFAHMILQRFSLNGEVVLEEIEGLNDTKMHIKILDMWVYAEGMHGYVFKQTAVPFGTFSLSPVFQQGHLCFSGSCLAT